MKEERRGATQLGWLAGLTKIALLVGLALWMIGVGLGIGRYQTAMFMAIGALFLVGMLMISIGGVMSLIVAFFESVAQGLLCFFVPFYQLFYLVSRWPTMKRPFFLSLGGLSLILAAGLTAALFPDEQRPMALADPPGVDEPGALANPGIPSAGPAVALDLDPSRGPAVPDVGEQAKLKATEPEPPRTAPDPVAREGMTPARGMSILVLRRRKRTTVVDDEFVEAILATLQSSELEERKVALSLLRRAKPTLRRLPEVAKAVEPMLIDPDGFGRSDAAQVLAVWGGPENSPALIEALQDESFGVRWAVLDTLKVLKDPKTAPAWSRPSARTTQERRSRRLKAIGSGAEDAQIPCLRQGPEKCRAACQILKEIGTEKSVAELREVVLGDSSETMQARDALKAIARRSKAAGSRPAP